MSRQPFTIGDIVSAAYKSGEYIGELIEIKNTKAVIKVLAVLKHPTQGNLHSPNDANVPLFHQRPALSFQEFALVPLASVQRYEDDLPDYKESLDKAIDRDIHKLRQDQTSEWSQRSLAELENLKKDYK